MTAGAPGCPATLIGQGEGQMGAMGGDKGQGRGRNGPRGARVEHSHK
jgi:hypothetical protein